MESILPANAIAATVVIQKNGAIINCINSTAAVRVIIVDEDVEGCSPDELSIVNGDPAYITHFLLNRQALWGGGGINHGIEADFVDFICSQLESEGQDVSSTMSLSQAPSGWGFQISTDDIETVLRANQQRLVAPTQEALAIRAEALLPSMDGLRIEAAALAAGSDLDEQTVGAHQEIEAILVELGVFKA